MRTTTFHWKKTVIASATALTLLAAPVFMGGMISDDLVAPALFSQASAAQGSGKGQQGGGGGGQGAGKAGGQAGGQMQGAGGQGGAKSIDRVLEAEEVDDDSDRPTWAGQPGGEDRPGGGGNVEPGTVKGDEYGDLIVLLRDPVTGEPIMQAGEYLVCLDAACEQEPVPTVEGEVPAGVTPVEVDFGRASLARAPTSVIDHALEEALSNLTADGVVLATDPAGRITYTVDGVTNTIDSPLENLALYVDLMTGLASNNTTSETEAALGDLATLDTAAALLAGAADKTGDISLDFVVYENVIADVVADADSYYDFKGFTYDRDFGETTYWVSIDGADPVTMTIDLDAYLEAINGELPDSKEFAALFAAAADDALEVIEFVHTAVQTEILPGTVE
jgi:hypothetical protein